MSIQLVIKALLSGILVVAISELAKKNNLVASVVHSLPLLSLLALCFLYSDTKDATLVGRHAWSTFWFVLPTLPMFLLMPSLIKWFGGFWPAIGVGVLLTVTLYWVTMRLLTLGGVSI